MSREEYLERKTKMAKKKTRDIEIEACIVPETRPGPLWHGVVDIGTLLEGVPSGNFVSLLPEGYREEDAPTGWYRRLMVKTSIHNLGQALVDACWNDETLSATPDPFYGLLNIRRLQWIRHWRIRLEDQGFTGEDVKSAVNKEIATWREELGMDYHTPTPEWALEYIWDRALDDVDDGSGYILEA